MIFINHSAVSSQVDPAYGPYISALNSMPPSVNIDLALVKELEKSAASGDLQAQVKYHYVALVYLSEGKKIKLPIDANEIRKQIEQDRRYAEYVYNCKVNEKKELQNQLRSVKGTRPYTLNGLGLSKKDIDSRNEKISNLEYEVSVRNSLMNGWRHKTYEASLRLDLWHKLFQEK